MEPIFIAQTAEPEHMTSDGFRQWIADMRVYAEERGVTFARVSLDNHEKPTMGIIEGWKEQPQDQGEIRWSFTPAPQEDQ